MPYVIQERLSAGGRKMFLKINPLVSNCIGTWTLSLRAAASWEVRIAADAACDKLALCNAGTVKFVTERSMEKDIMSHEDNTKWVVQSNVSGEYLVAVTIPIKSSERWSDWIRDAIRFDTMEEARELTSEFIVGVSNAPQALDIDYVQINSMTNKPLAYGSKLEEELDVRKPAEKRESKHIVRCRVSNLYFEAHKVFSQIERWTQDKRLAKRFDTAILASSAILRMENNPRVEIIEEKKLVSQEKPEDTVSIKKNFRIKMRHGPGYSVEKTVIGMTEAEAVHAMFKEVAGTQKKRFDMAVIEPVGPNATAGSIINYAKARDVKSM
jgi:hypothetical protein